MQIRKCVFTFVCAVWVDGISPIECRVRCVVCCCISVHKSATELAGTEVVDNSAYFSSKISEYVPNNKFTRHIGYSGTASTRAVSRRMVAAIFSKGKPSSRSLAAHQVFRQRVHFGAAQRADLQRLTVHVTCLLIAATFRSQNCMGVLNAK